MPSALLAMALLSTMDPLLQSEFLVDETTSPSCHASTIVETKPGHLVSAWFGGRNEGASDVAIYVTRSDGNGWSAPAEVTRATPFSCYNPVLFQPKVGPLLLFYKAGSEPSRWWGMVMRSEDGGEHWSKPERLPEGILGPIKNPPIELPGRRILCPSSTELGGWRIHFEWTKDLGKTWSKTEPLNDAGKIGAIQPSILRLGGDKLRAIGRTQQQRMFAIDSDDLGRTWGPMRLLDVPNPNSGTDAISLRDGRFLLVYNESVRQRTPLRVAISKDAEQWTNVVTLEDQPGEYSYPTVIQTSDGLVHVTYTWHRRRIRHVVLDPAKYL